MAAADAAEVFAYRCLPEVRRFQSFEPRSLADVEQFIAGTQSVKFGDPGPWCQLAIRLRAEGLLIGDLGVRVTAEDPRQVEIGFTLAPAYQGRGYATEAVSGLIGHLLGPLAKHRVFASADPRNARSLALLERVGMRREAHFHESLWFKGEWVDDVVYAILESLPPK
ncbi:MAG: GNAT family N-acetyltransferase [bacterium]|nr:GNAT family N-acetyltransferase [bacterium]